MRPPILWTSFGTKPHIALGGLHKEDDGHCCARSGSVKKDVFAKSCHIRGLQRCTEFMDSARLIDKTCVLVKLCCFLTALV